MNLSVILNRMYNSLFSKAETFEEKRRIRKYLKNGRVPWSVGYADFKKMELIRILNDERIIQSFIGKELPAGFGIGIDERIIEYPWILSRLSNNPSKILDAGSTFNFDIILDSKKIAQKELTICTFYPEEINYNKKRISYVYSDLRQLPFKDEL
ncbi:MAG: methylase, partial [Bacteroidota bacterium]